MPLAVGSSGDGGDGDGGDRASVFFERGRAVADTRSSEYAIEMFLQGLALDPDNVAAHKELRVIALRRKADGGKDLGTLEKMKLKASLGKGDDHKQSMLKAEKLLAYNPGNVEWMISVATHASRAGFQNAADWFTEIARRAAGN